MEWVSDWWGIEIIAEKEEDIELLKKINSVLKNEAYSSYEDGEKTFEKIDNKYILTLNR